ncbi:MAG: FAD-dependent oxidoreductase [Acidobacteriota bacterium]
MKIAVIGGGVSGLTAAWLLSRQHDVQLYEREARLGGHAHTHAVRVGSGVVPVDTGFMVFNQRTYPTFVAMLAALGVESRASDMSFSVRCDRCDVAYSSVGLRGLFAHPRRAFTTAHLAMLAEILRFFRAGRRALGDGSAALMTLGDFLDAHRFGAAVVGHFVLPMGGAIWSASGGAMRAFSATSYLRFLDNHGLLAVTGQPVWRTVVGGSGRYVERIAETLGDGVHVGLPVRRVTRTASGVTLELDGEPPQSADAVVIATHADEALALLGDPSPEESAALGAFGYSRNPTVLHSDATYLPGRPAARASWNVRLRDCRAEHEPVEITYDLTRLQGLGAAEPMLCTLNDHGAPAQVHARMDYSHPILDQQAVVGQQRIAALNGARHTYYCGAHLGYGFHEDGARSAVTVAARLGVPL